MAPWAFGNRQCEICVRRPATPPAFRVCPIISTSCSEGKRLRSCPPALLYKMRGSRPANRPQFGHRGAPGQGRRTFLMEKDYALAGQVAVITGAGRGIGAAIAQALARLGAVSVVCGRTRAALESVAQAIAQAGGKAEVVPCDVSNLESVEAAAKRVEGSFGRLDILVNNAGVGGFGGPLHQLPPDAWDQILNTNLRGVYYTTPAFAPMPIRPRSRHIIKLSSLAVKKPVPNGTA